MATFTSTSSSVDSWISAIQARIDAANGRQHQQAPAQVHQQTEMHQQAHAQAMRNAEQAHAQAMRNAKQMHQQAVQMQAEMHQQAVAAHQMMFGF